MRGRSVLLVEDDPDAAEIMCDVITALGHSCRVAHAGREAIQLARNDLPDVAMVDIGLPDVPGFEVARTLRGYDATGSLDLVALTGYADAAHRQRAFAAGFDRYLVKPISLAAIARAIANAEQARHP